MKNSDGVILKKCPLCGGDIEISYLYQYSHTYKLTKSGRISKKYYTTDNGSIDASIAGCKCGAYWDEDQFLVDEEGNFIDYKYNQKNRDK